MHVSTLFYRHEMELATPCINFNLKQGADRRETAVNGEHVKLKDTLSDFAILPQ